VATGLSHRRGLAAIAIAIGGLVGPVSADGDGPSVARKWQELLLDSIRRDFGRPTIHARNLFHLSVAMWDAWATYDARATPWISTERHQVKVADAALSSLLASRGTGGVPSDLDLDGTVGGSDLATMLGHWSSN